MKRFFLCLFMAFPFLCFAQADFQKGYVVTNSKDTLTGYIDYPVRWANPRSFEFKPLKRTAESQFFTLKDCDAFAFDDKPPFRRFIINISMVKDNGNPVPGFKGGTKRDTAFLQILQDGKNVTLFRYRDSLKKRFYVLDKDGVEPLELINLPNQTGDKSIKEKANYQYVSQIRSLLRKFNAETESNLNKLTSLKYVETDLRSIVAKLNDEEIAKPKFSRARIFFGAGFVGAKAGYKNLYRGNLESLDTKYIYNPKLTVGVDLFNDPAVGQVIYRIEASVSKNKYSITRNFDQIYMLSSRHSFDQLNVSLNPQGIYNVYNTDKIKLFVGAGMALNFLSNTNNETVIHYRWKTEDDGVDPKKVNLNDFYVSIAFKAGITLNKRFELAAGYNFPNSITYESRLNVSTLHLGFNYLLSNKR